jgi:putative amide transporter protein
MFVGSVLYVNGLWLLGLIDARSAAVFNLLIGALEVVAGVYLTVTADTQDQVFIASSIFLFAFTYLYVGVTTLADHSPSGLGWYCSWVAVMAVAYSAAQFVHFDDPIFGMMWLSWAFLWAVFFALLALKWERLTRFAGWLALIESWVTCAIPGFLILGGWWHRVSTTVAVVAAALMVLVLAVVAARTSGRPSPQPTSG